ncbi:TAXI family TRAP transporter solute-binding subunit [Marinomonas rhizomae]|uniref:TRAP transporter TAXI family solute receptor n=1 Tax=Marinomonas rhizomae TaxID=491948 RepID=A0A366J0C2_9GAMM|nr:TAXI family TRAP transporter solute-binding subunit [Marinomonas rhizomae]RBP80513.1 TRAP transporter TAXI family solute receptor [Marinomonas rhizomae]RNF71750.1 TAXI family TRAP transporter solute-binding subunit [Marinomonas rhizomae]
MKFYKAVIGTAIGLAVTQLSFGQTQLTFKSAKTSSSYYQMAVEIAQAVKKDTDSNLIVTVEESQGSVQNVMETAFRGANYVFTTPPALVNLAQNGKAMFKNKSNPKFNDIRALFPIPSLAMHFVVSDKSAINNFADMADKKILLGKGTFGANEGAKYIKLFGLENKIDLAQVELSNAVPALKNGQIDGFVTSGSFPAPNVIEASAGTKVKILSFSDDQIAQTKRTKLIIPAGTYAGQNTDINTTSLPVVVYTSKAMDDATAYTLTKAFWDQKKNMSDSSPWWKGVTTDMLSNIDGKIHPGAAKYYREIGISLNEQQQ